jgi:hypothetical protein
MTNLRKKAAAACIALALLTPMAGLAESCVTVGTKYVIATIFGYEISVTVSTTTCTE